MSDITRLLRAVEKGDQHAPEQLLPLVYDELRHLAARRLRQESDVVTLQPTALVHEAWLRLAHQEGREWNDRHHFFRAAALAMRRILVDEARKKATHKRGRRMEKLDIAELDLSDPEPDERVLLVNEALVQLEAEDPDSARLITYKFFGGFTNEETAEMLGVSERTLNRQWAYAKACLYRLLRQGMETEASTPSADTPEAPPAPTAARDQNA